jgi:Ser/Thr protein kinase RdoA (MazF antagonist)
VSLVSRLAQRGRRALRVRVARTFATERRFRRGTAAPCDGSAFGLLAAPEGTRAYVLFPRLEGIRRAPVDEAFARESGRLITEVHTGSERFSTRAQRFELDVAHLLEEPLAAVRRSFAHLPAELAELSRRVDALETRIARLPRALPDWGPCHGDLHFENVIFNEQGAALLDFDSSGFGWRLYDLATFLWSIKLKWPGWAVQYAAPDDVLWSAFLNAYRERRPLDQATIEQLPALVAARHVWALGLQAANAGDWAAYGWLTDDFLRSQLAFLGELMTALS